MLTFDLYSFRFHLSARTPIHFPEGSAGNVLRGALGAGLRKIHCASDCPGQRGRPVRECKMSGSCRYAQIFEPLSTGAGPSGLAERPRPFVIRAAHLNGRTVAAGETFWFDLNVFRTREPNLPDFVAAFGQFADLLSVEQIDSEGRPVCDPISVTLDPSAVPVSRVRVEFRTPTELKGANGTKPAFTVLFARSQDRVSTLRQMYGPGPITVDFCAMRGRAAEIRMTRCELRHVVARRRSSRTGQVHGIGGFVGVADYEGDLGEFVPYLEAARWTGVGRQCTWGKGEVRVELLP